MNLLQRQIHGFCFVFWVLALTATTALAWPTVYPLGTTVYNPEKAFNGYTLYSPISDKPTAPEATLYLINMNGAVMREWTLPFSPILQGKLQTNGNVTIIGQNSEQKPGRPGVGKYWMGGAAGWLVELNWEGKIVFKHQDLNMHHDFVKLANGNYLYLTWEPVPAALRARVRGGIEHSEHKDGTMFNDRLVEINPQGKVVWTWRANGHLDPNVDIIGPVYNRDEWLHANSVAMLSNGNILLTSRSTDAVLIIDKKSGKIISRIGNSVYLDKKSGQLKQRKSPEVFGGPHDAQQIPAGYFNGGKVLVLDNGVYTYKSRAVVFDPATGKVLGQWPPGGQFGRLLFSYFLGGIQPLPNGNLLICDGANGRFMQGPISTETEIVWEYINPFTPTPQINGIVFKAHMYGQNYCPQFGALPPAKGDPVVPANPAAGPPASTATETASAPAPMPAAQESSQLLTTMLAFAMAALAASVAINIFLWKRLS